MRRFWEEVRVLPNNTDGRKKGNLCFPPGEKRNEEEKGKVK